MNHPEPSKVKFGSKDKARKAVERKAAKRRTRPAFVVKGQVMRGLLPAELDALHDMVDQARGRYLREHLAHKERMRLVELP